MLKKNTCYEAEITDYTAEGLGVAHVDGVAVFVPNAIAGERCVLKITKVTARSAIAKIESICQKSPHRISRACAYAKLCGGCNFQHMDYQEECRLKAQRVTDALHRLGGQQLQTVPITAAEQICAYRNKAQFPVSARGDLVQIGFYKARTHTVLPIDHCLIQNDQANTVKDVVQDFMQQYRVRAYDEMTHTGLVRHVYVRSAAATGELMVCLVLNGSKLPHAEALVQMLRRKLPQLTTLVCNENTKKGNSILSDKMHVLYGPGYIEDVLCNLRFRISPKSFYQVNHAQAQRLYELAIAAAGLTGRETVLDLYCGTGTITLAMAKYAHQVIGVEIIDAAIEDAKNNAARNGITNARFFCADAGQAAAELAREQTRPDVIVVDPPRKGLAPEVIQAMASMAPERIVYVSCDPATLARDVKLLCAHGYMLRSAQAVDMFPRCAHVETVVLLSKGEIDAGKN